MRISSSWLAEFVPLPAPEQLENTLLMAGLGIEAHEGDRLELEVTSNRGDWLSAVGLAREIGAMTENRSRVPAPDVEESGAHIEGRVHIEIENPADCSRYVARLVENIELGPSPDWMQEKLLDCGVRPINNVVDVTNYVMMELGQPLHAFDFSDVSGEKIVVRRARNGEKLTTLDEVERELSPDVLAICDAEKPIGIAGVMGGLDSEVKESTKTILLESAHFAPTVVRKSAYSLGLATEASRRFERWVDPNGCRKAADRAAQLLVQIAGAKVAAGAVDRYLAPHSEVSVALRPARCNAVLGLKIPVETMRASLERLGFKVSGDAQQLRAIAPSWRRDIEREEDLIEEVARLYGYNRVPTTLHESASAGAGRPLSMRLEDRARSAMLRCGLTEITTYSLSNEDAHQKAGESVERAVKLRNPLSEDYTLLRTSLLPSLLDVLRRNSRQRLLAFEFGKIYLTSHNQLPDETRMLGMALNDAPRSPHWQMGRAQPDFYRLKAVVENVFQEFGAPQPIFRPARHPAFHPGRCAALDVDGQELGIIGEIHPDTAEVWDLAGRAWVALVDFDVLVRHITVVPQYRPFAKFPAADRDLAFVVPQTLLAGVLTGAVRRAGGDLLESARIFDVYQGKNIPEGSKSLALALRFRAADRTLGESEIEAAMTRILEAANELGAQIRS